ncbi:hypothetical protein NGRA_3199 [Nosema granulosis]|uniref:Integrase zinc-binding domain-containing protein n=1 Tax=Nosema granulosis TaxID=83296 RepID=A0A9P6GVW8_9MICR|nr:hypothetical protein NGRA_3199 [Nosema granulosis]
MVPVPPGVRYGDRARERGGEPKRLFKRLAVNEIEQMDEKKEYGEIKDLHERLAHGSQKTMEYHLRGKNINKVREKVIKVIDDCLTCQRMGRNYKKRNIIAIRTKRTNEIWEIDLVGPLPKSRNGYSYIHPSS